MAKKTNKIVLAVAAVLIVALLAVAYVTNGALGKVDCPDCEDGTVDCAQCLDGVQHDPAEVENADEFDACAKCAVCNVCEGAASVSCETCSGDAKVTGTFWAIIPPFIAIALALITKEVYSSLFIGIGIAGILAANFSVTGTVDTIINDGLISAVSDTAGIFVFLVELGIMVALINHAGGSAAFGNWAKKHVKTKVGASLATFVLGVLIFIDDYFNCLTVGSVMRPVTDKNNISRAKLAYLIDATAAPVCMIAPISSWAAAVASYAEEGQGLKLFISAIPFNFYSLLTFVFIIAIVLMRFDYGPMKKSEMNAKEELAALADEANEKHESKGKVIDLVLPVIVLIAVCVFALVYNGGILDGENFIDAFANTDATVGLPWGGLIALIFTIVFFICRGLIDLKGSMDCVPKGFNAMVPAILILTFATALKNVTGILGTKYFVGDLMAKGGSLDVFLPAVIFLVACVLAFATGTSWGTFGILIPIVNVIFVNDPTLLTIGMSACLAGAVCGDHCSPISDTTIMSSAGAQCDHVEHVSTQLPYAITVAAVSFVCYILAGFIQNAWIVLPIGAALIVGTLFVIKAVTEKKAK